MDDLILEDKKGEKTEFPPLLIRRSSASIRGLEMKRSNDVAGGSVDEKCRSASDKEKTKLRERKRRAITTKIFHGLRKHGGYNLTPRADINDVLRHLAGEAGWVIESDGTTYRGKGPLPHLCPACGYRGFAPSATGSYAVGDCSTTASPRQTMLIQQPSPSSSDGAAVAAAHLFDMAAASSSTNRVVAPESDLSLALSMGDEVAAYLLGGTQAYYTAAHGVSGGTLVMIPGQHQKAYLQEARASNQNTPIGSPQR